MNLWRAIIDFFASGQRENGGLTNPPVKSAIALTTHETGITLEFPMREDRRPILRALAWRQFHTGLFLLVAPLLIHAGCQFFGFRNSINYLAPIFLSGLVMLAAAANGSSVITKTAYDDDLYQLSVVDNLLVRTSRDLRKLIWYRLEIRDILVRDCTPAFTSEFSSKTTTLGEPQQSQLIIRLNSGETVHLATTDGTFPLSHFRPREELEWVATQLRLALFPAAPIAADNPHATAIRAVDAPREETRYTE